MNFAGLFDDGSLVLPYSSSIVSQHQSLVSLDSTPKQMLNATNALSLSLTKLESGRQSREEENESRSGSDHFEGGSGDELELENPRKRKKYHRHTPQQIQELEALFKECPHPDEKQRLELSKRLNLEIRQVKFWFQNRRTQMKTQLDRRENSILRQEHEKLRAENLAFRVAVRNPICNNCGGPAVLGEISIEEQHLRVENAQLKEELDRVCALAGKFVGKPLSGSSNTIPLPMPNSLLELGVGTGNAIIGSNTLPHVTELSSPKGSAISTPLRTGNTGVYMELALTAMDELVKMAQLDEPLWISSLDGGLVKETLNFEEYRRCFAPCIGAKPIGFVSEATRETGVVIMNSFALVETLMDATRWAEVFPCVVARATTSKVISSGMGGTRNGALLLMQAELQVLSPLVPVREVNFLRFCKQISNGGWAIVDVSIDENGHSSLKCRRLPSGCVVQDMANGYSKVTWVEHTEYDETVVHSLYRPLYRSGLALGAGRWVATLQRQCQALVSPPRPSKPNSPITASGARSMLKLAQRMTGNFCAGVCPSSAREWRKVSGRINVGKDVRVMTRQSVGDPGEPPGVVLSAATSVWLPTSPQLVFDFLRNEHLRCQWDILSNGGPMQEIAHIAKGQDNANAVSLLRATAVGSNQTSMLILEETLTDSSGSMVIYAPVDVPAMHLVMSGGDSSYVALLPSGFVILPDGTSSATTTSTSTTMTTYGSILTVAFQILVDSQPSANLTLESVDTVNNLISCTVQKIKAALNCESNA